MLRRILDMLNIEFGRVMGNDISRSDCETARKCDWDDGEDHTRRGCIERGTVDFVVPQQFGRVDLRLLFGNSSAARPRLSLRSGMWSGIGVLVLVGPGVRRRNPRGSDTRGVVRVVIG
jgi:hypothetical protein